MSDRRAAGVAIRELVSIEDRKAAFELRYRVHVDELGQSQSSADHARQLIFDALDHFSTVYGAFLGTRIVATMRITWGEYFTPKEAGRIYGTTLSQYHHTKTAFTNRVCVDSEWRRSLVLHRMFAFAYAQALDRGVKADFTYCTTGLLRFYEKLGYNKIGEYIFDDLGHREIIFSEIDDLVVHRQRKTVFLRILEGRSRGSLGLPAFVGA